MAFGPDGSLYFADRGNNVVRWISPGGIIGTVAGSRGLGGYAGDGGPATQAKLNSPYGVAIGRDGSLFVGDQANDRVRVVSTSGIITTVAGDGVQGYAGDAGPATRAGLIFPTGLAVTPDGSLLITDDSTVRRVSPAFPGVSLGQLDVPSADGSALYIFDSSGRHLQTLNTLTGATLLQFAYQGGRLNTIIDADGNITAIDHDTVGNPTAIFAPFGQKTTLVVDGNGYLSSVTDPVGNVVQLTSSATGLLSGLIDPRGGAHSFTFDGTGRLTRDQEPDGSAKTLTRTSTATGYEVAVTTDLGRTTLHAVSRLSDGSIQQTVTEPDGTHGTSVIGTDGTITMTEADGTVTSFTLAPDPRFGLLTPLTANRSTKTPGGLTSTTSMSRSVTLSDPTNPLSVMQLTDAITINGQTYQEAYNGTARTFTLTSPVGRTSTATTDALGRIVQAQQANFLPVALNYDTHGRVSSVSQGSGASTRTSTYIYDAASNVATLTDPLQRSTSLTHDADGQVLQATLPDGQSLGIVYDPSSDVTSVTPPGQPAHAFAYTSVGQLASDTPPDVGGGTTATGYNYNLDHQLTEVDRPDGLKLDYTYDAAGRFSTVAIPTGQLAFAYNATSGYLSTLDTSSGMSLAFTYDGGLPTSETLSGPVAGSVGAAYDNNFRPTSQSLNGAGLTLQYDNDGQITGVGSLAIQRDPATGFGTSTSLGTVSDATTYNGFAELASYSAATRSSPIYNAQYARDSLGRVTQKVESIGGATNTYAYAYDVRGRLVQVQKDGVTASTYAYGANGNRLSFTGPGGTVSGTYDVQDRMLAYGGTTYAYTPNGELQSATTTGQITTYQYDVLGNLLAVGLPNDTQITYVVDGANRRVAKRLNGAVTQAFVYAGGTEPIAQLDGGNSVVSRFVYATRANVPDYIIKNGSTYRILSDDLGSPRLVVDTSTGSVVEQLTYDEFGNVLQDTNPGFQPFGFAGGLYDPDTKLLRFGGRDYDPSTGRWTAKDPGRFLSGTNVYAYAGNDPVNLVDIDGDAPKDSKDTVVGYTGPLAEQEAADRAAAKAAQLQAARQAMLAAYIQMAQEQNPQWHEWIQSNAFTPGSGYNGSLIGGQSSLIRNQIEATNEISGEIGGPWRSSGRACPLPEALAADEAIERDVEVAGGGGAVGWLYYLTTGSTAVLEAIPVVDAVVTGALLVDQWTDGAFLAPIPGPDEMLERYIDWKLTH
jgi:RHS repeat-associated protein